LEEEGGVEVKAKGGVEGVEVAKEDTIMEAVMLQVALLCADGAVLAVGWVFTFAGSTARGAPLPISTFGLVRGAWTGRRREPEALLAEGVAREVRGPRGLLGKDSRDVNLAWAASTTSMASSAVC
jgi:hypothetical protein